MGARLVVRFASKDLEERIQPRVYLHHEGEYKRDIEETMDQFLAAVGKLGDKRLDDPSYLSAKLIVNEAAKQGCGLGFLSVGIVCEDSWGDAVCVVNCDGSGTYEIVSALDVEGK